MDKIKIGTALQRERSDTHKLDRGLPDPKQNASGQAPATFCQQNDMVLQPQGDPTCRNSAEGCMCKHETGTATRHKKPEFRSHLGASLEIVRCLRHKYCACHEISESEAYTNNRVTQAKCTFTISRGTFQREGCQVCRWPWRTPTITRDVFPLP